MRHGNSEALFVCDEVAYIVGANAKLDPSNLAGKLT
jgi:hypothetical protein